MIPDKYKHLVKDGFTPIPILIKEGAWRGIKGWIVGPKNQVESNPIITEGGNFLDWFDSEIEFLKN